MTVSTPASDAHRRDADSTAWHIWALPPVTAGIDPGAWIVGGAELSDAVSAVADPGDPTGQADALDSLRATIDHINSLVTAT
ncbi:hypothetical protein K7711_46490 [Nocardia sp. CA2R105]|uniref:hypothetical protein n=1 Tax=Nocardia coffeae TaxID=2873381 RepID=UPI001CA64107|nr:hypothetical protein [Nocardia coffeae]MBY8863981.1 hypothetical protein [Nocardia coffeae]